MDVTEKLIERIVQDATPVKAAGHPFVLSAKWLGGMLAYLAISVAVLHVRPDLMIKLQSPLFMAEIGLLACIMITTAVSAALLVFPDMHQKRWLAFAPGLMAVFFVSVIFLAWQADSPAAPPPVHNLKCTLSIAMLALLPALWMFYLMRNFASTHPYSAGSIALLSAFSMGALSLRLTEPTDSIMHVVQWHYLPMVAAGVVGLWLGKKFLKW